MQGVYLSILCVTYSFVKQDISSGICKKEKKCRKKTYFNIDFYYFYTCHIKGYFILKPLCGQIELEDIYTIF
jgi:hypothetical protein